MARNANFSVVASLRGDEVNLRLAAAIGKCWPAFLSFTANDYGSRRSGFLRRIGPFCCPDP